MLVKERMKSPVITVKPDMPAMDVINLMKRDRIRRGQYHRHGHVLRRGEHRPGPDG